MDGGLLQKFTYDELIDNLMMYWAPNSITTAMRMYAENVGTGKFNMFKLTPYVIIFYSKFSLFTYIYNYTQRLIQYSKENNNNNR